MNCFNTPKRKSTFLNRMFQDHMASYCSEVCTQKAGCAYSLRSLHSLEVCCELEVCSLACSSHHGFPFASQWNTTKQHDVWYLQKLIESLNKNLEWDSVFPVKYRLVVTFRVFLLGSGRIRIRRFRACNLCFRSGISREGEWQQDKGFRLLTLFFLTIWIPQGIRQLFVVFVI